MNKQTAIIPAEYNQVIELVTNALTSEHSKRAYSRAIVDFLAWRGNRPMTKALVNEYRQSLTGSASRVNLIMSALRKLASEAADNGMLDQQTANGIKAAPGVKSHGVRVGNWLTKRDAQRLLTAPELTDDDGKADPKAYRDRAILAVMIGAGLRRSEVTALTFDHIQQRDNRWVIVDIIGKGNHVRSVPIAAWIKTAIDEWQAVGNVTGRVFQAIHKGGHITRDSMTPQAIRDVIKYYGAAIGRPELAAHDLRRTYAKLARKGGADVLQIGLSLGHLSIKTTERYLGEEQDLTDAPGDRLGLSLE
jgi:site-specific recombinase XerC